MKVGDSIKIKKGIKDPDTGLQLDGFIGRIKEKLGSDLINIEWDSKSLEQLPDTYIRSAIEGGCDYLSYNIELKEVEKCEARDTASNVSKMVIELSAKWHNLEVFGELAELIEEIEEMGWDDYLEKEITFPFKATYEDEYNKYGKDAIMKVHSIHDFDDHYGFITKCKFGRKTIYLNMCELTAEPEEPEATINAVELYKEYFWNQ